MYEIVRSPLCSSEFLHEAGGRLPYVRWLAASPRRERLSVAIAIQREPARKRITLACAASHGAKLLLCGVRAITHESLLAPFQKKREQKNGEYTSIAA